MVLNDFRLYDAGPEYASVGGAQMIADYMNFRTMNLDEYMRTRSHSTLVRWLLGGSEAARYFYRRLVLRRIARATLEGYRGSFRGMAREEGFAHIRDMARLSQRFLVVLFPLFVDFKHYPLADVHRSIVEELRASHIEVLDLYDVYRGMDASQLTVFETDQHPNEEAHRIAAGAIRDKLRELGWPPFDSAPAVAQ
jgi:hypothetical protein